MAVDANGGLDGHTSDSSAFPKSATNSENVELSALPSTMPEEEDAVEYIHGPRFGLICAS
jgi:hypothetical protein